MPKKKVDTLVPLGNRIKKARTNKKIKLKSLANDTGYSVEYLSQIEANTTIPHVGALLQISRALDIDSGLFPKEQESSLKDRVNAYTKRTDNYSYTTITPGAEKNHLKAFRVSIDPLKNHKGVGYCHEGEEIIYVLQGSIEVTVGDQVNTLKMSDSLLFNSGIKHQIKNISEEKAELLVVVYSP